MSANDLMKTQISAQDNMIKDLVGQIQQQKKEGQELVSQNYAINDQLLKAQQESELLKLKIKQLQQGERIETEEEKSNIEDQE